MKTFKEVKQLVLNKLKKFNYTDLTKDISYIGSTIVADKELVSYINECTKFIDDIYIGYLKYPYPTLNLRIYCILNDIDSVEKYPKCIVCKKRSCNFINISSGFTLTCGDKSCYKVVRKQIIKNKEQQDKDE